MNEQLDLSKLKTGDVVLLYTEAKLFKPSSWVAPLIRKIAKCDYNHAGIIISNWNKPFLNEAIGEGIIGRPVMYQLNHHKVKILRSKNHSPKSYDEEKDFANRANEKLGTKYDFISLLLFLVLYQLTTLWIGRKREKVSKKMYCYEYVAYCFPKLFLEFWKILPNDFLTEEFEEIYKTE